MVFLAPPYWDEAGAQDSPGKPRHRAREVWKTQAGRPPAREELAAADEFEVNAGEHIQSRTCAASWLALIENCD